MKFVTINNKKILLIPVIVFVVVLTLIINTSLAKYTVTKSIPIASGTINYSPADFILMGIYIQNGSEYESVEEIPVDRYEFNSELSYCEKSGVKQEVELNYDIETKNLTITPFTIKGLKCYLYFDESDKEPPTDNSIVINSGDAYTTNTNVTLTLASTGASEMCISNTTSCTSWEEYTTSKNWELTSTIGEQIVYVWYRDEVGNTAEYVSDTITLRGVISTVPTQSGSLTYSGSSQAPSWNNYNTTELTIGGTVTGTNAGSYTATFTPTENYEWSDGTTTAKSVTWTIRKKLQITTQPSSGTVYVGEKFTTTVVADGDGLTYQWYVASANSSSFNKSSVTSAKYTSSAMTLTRNGQKFYCIITDQYGNTIQTNTITVTVKNPSPKDTILANMDTITTRSSFSTTYTSTTTGTIFTADDDDGTSYYFAGAPTDNYVKFAGFYWRIIRINGDGTIRLIYHGTSTTATGSTTILTNTSKFNNSFDNNAYVGYMYTNGNVQGLGTSSTVKNVIDAWYIDNLSTQANYIDTNAGFCGDRTPSTSNSTSNGNGGTGFTTTYYGAYIRLYVNKSPSFKCPNSLDLYTTNSSSKGNKALTYPIGLITADEISYAGAPTEKSNTSIYLYTNEDFWTMSPAVFATAVSDGYTYWTYAVYYFSNSGGMTHSLLNPTLGIKPVINLRADVTLSGAGTASNPYTVS